MKIYYLLGVLLLVYSCNDEGNNHIDQPPDKNIDSTVYEVFLTISDNGISQMKKYHGDTLTEKINISYFDSVVEKRLYHYDSLLYKGVFYVGENNYATHSLDSFFYQGIYFETLYTYDELGYIKEEKHIPGLYYLKEIVDWESSEYTMFNFRRYEGNVYKYDFILAPGIGSTVVLDYKYSDLPQAYDIIGFKNSIVGEPNRNLPSKFGWQDTGPPGRFTEKVRYEYILKDSLVLKRTDLYIFKDEILLKEIMYYTYD